MANIIDFIQATLFNGGASYNIVTGEFNPSDGYMVSLAKNLERTFPIPTSLQEMKDSFNTYCKAVGAWKRISNGNDNIFFGSWIYEGKLYLDLSEKIDRLSDATELAEQRSQIAIFDNANKCEIVFTHNTQV